MPSSNRLKNVRKRRKGFSLFTVEVSSQKRKSERKISEEKRSPDYP